MPVGSNALYQSGLIMEGDLENIPRRKTVGFKGDMNLHRKLTISEKGNCDESANHETTVVMIDDVDTKHSHSQVLFDQASDADLQQSLVKEVTAEDM